MQKAAMSVLPPTIWSARFMIMRRARSSSSRHRLLARTLSVVPGWVRFPTSWAAIRTSRRTQALRLSAGSKSGTITMLPRTASRSIVTSRSPWATSIYRTQPVTKLWWTRRLCSASAAMANCVFASTSRLYPTRRTADAARHPKRRTAPMLASLVPSRGDVFGGISAGIVALPLCLAFGAASGLGPEAGLYGAIAAGILAAIFGGTPVLVTGPTNPMTLVAATVVAANMLPNGKANLTVIVTDFLLAGALQVLLGVLRLGGFVRYVPYPVISGFMSGIGLIIIIQQLYPIVGAEPPSSDAVKILRSLPMLPGHIVWPVALLGITTLAIIQILPRLTRKIPASLVALLVVTACAVAFGINASRIGTIPAGLPALVIPKLTFDQGAMIVTAAIELALLGAIDSLLSALLADSLTKSHHDSNRELIGQGIGNMGAALVGGLPGAGANIRTIVNIEAGGKTRLSGVIHGLFLLAVLLGLSKLVQYIPHAVLSGILVGAGLGCIDLRGLSHIHKVPRSDAAVLLVVLALTVFSGLIVAVAVGLIMASLIFMKNVADISERQTALSPLADEAWAAEIDGPVC